MMTRNTIRFSNAIRNNVILKLVYQALLMVNSISGQDASIKLEQGTVVGVIILKKKVIFSHIHRVFFVVKGFSRSF